MNLAKAVSLVHKKVLFVDKKKNRYEYCLHVLSKHEILIYTKWGC